MAVPHFVLKCVVETVSSDEADFHSWTFAHSVWWSWEWRSWNRRSSTLWQTAEWTYLHCSDASINWVDELICGNHRITTDALCTTLFLGKGKKSEIIEQLGFQVLCLLVAPNADRFVQRHLFEPESKWQSIEWCHMVSPRKKNQECTVRWKNHGYSLLRWERCHSSCLEGMILNSVCFIEKLRSTDAHSHQVCPTVSTTRTLGCTQLCTPQAIKNFGGTVLLHPSYSPELTSSDYHLFGPFKSAVSTPLLQWWGPIECCAPEAAEGGEYLLPGGNTWSCSKVEGNLKEMFFHSCQAGTEVRKRCRSAHTWTWC